MHQIAFKPATAVSCSGTRRVFRNLVSRISRPPRVTSATVNFSASEILNPAAESSAINVAYPKANITCDHWTRGPAPVIRLEALALPWMAMSARSRAGSAGPQRAAAKALFCCPSLKRCSR